MKKSHIDWCPVIPDHWEEKRIKDIAFLQSGNSITAMDIAEEGKYPVYGGNGLRGYTNNYTNDGDYVLIGRQGALCGNINYAYGKFYATEHAVVVYTKNEEITYWLGETLKAANLNRLSMTAAQPGLAVSTLNIQFIPYPPRKERIRIANYLAEKCTEIDHQVSLLTSKRDAYLRLKKSIINHAVTHGLNPNVKMKDSGIEWIGEVPEHWEVKRMKDIFFERKELSLTGEEDLLSVSEFYGVARRKDKMNSDEEFESRADSLVGYKICKAHDLVINIMLAWKTGLGISDNDGIVSPAYAVYEGRNIASHFYHYLLRSGMYVKEFKRHSKGIIDSRLRLYNDRFNNISAIYPPLPEQRAIATYLDDKCAKIDTIVSNLDKQISRYGDLKRSLIDEVITGKRAVLRTLN